MTTSQPHIDRKDLKKPDAFVVQIGRIFQFFNANMRILLIIGIVVAGLAFGVMMYRNASAEKAEKAASALYEANKSLTEALKKHPATDAGWEAKVKPQLDEIEKVANQYKGTTSGYQGMIDIGNLYATRKNVAKATQYYEKAASMAKVEFLKISALFLTASMHEETKNYDASVNALQQVLKSKEKALRPLALSALGRNYELKGDTTKAVETYTLLVQEYPNSSYSQQAEQQKKNLSPDHAAQKK